MPWSKNGKIKVIYKLQLQMKGNPIHITEWLIHLSNLIILGMHKCNLNIDLGIQIQRLSSAILGNWSARMKCGHHNSKRQVVKIHGMTTKIYQDEQSCYSYHMNCIRDNYLLSRLSHLYHYKSPRNAITIHCKSTLTTDAYDKNKINITSHDKWIKKS